MNAISKSPSPIQTLFFRDWQWQFEVGQTFIGVIGAPVRGAAMPISFAYAPQVDLRYPVRVQAELKRQINQRWPKLPPVDLLPGISSLAL